MLFLISSYCLGKKNILSFNKNMLTGSIDSGKTDKNNFVVTHFLKNASIV